MAAEGEGFSEIALPDHPECVLRQGRVQDDQIIRSKEWILLHHARPAAFDHQGAQEGPARGVES